MFYQKTPTGYLLRIMRDEEIITALKRFCEAKGIGGAALSGIGAVKDARFGHYDLHKKKFVFTDYPGMLELVSMSGNITSVEGKPWVHVHGVFSDDENRALGGHVDSMAAAITAEIHLIDHGTAIEKKLDEFSGLKLMELEGTL
jgi:predicted DNA-binding protein with PD1-like motif